jgi:biopolymer transport protein ExbD
MPEKRRFLDVWIVESNTVYREVPFQVVTDWLQQGRLLEDDRLRPSGTAEWFRVGATPEFTPYLPQADAFRADDQAEALEPVEVDFRWRKPEPDVDEDVDMIPLIDVSLVLLIFFMLTATGVAGLFVPTPDAAHGHIADNADEIILGVDRNLDGKPVYKLTVGSRAPAPEDDNLPTAEALLERLRDRFPPEPGRVEVSINAHPDIPAGKVRDLLEKLEYPPYKGRIIRKSYGVHEAKE